jgi:hypothetical protein
MLVSVDLPTEFQLCPPATPTENVAVPLCRRETITKSPSCIEAGGVNVIVVVALVVAAPSAGTDAAPKKVIAMTGSRCY